MKIQGAQRSGFWTNGDIQVKDCKLSKGQCEVRARLNMALGAEAIVKNEVRCVVKLDH
jgi:hypothetical protein